MRNFLLLPAFSEASRAAGLALAAVGTAITAAPCVAEPALLRWKNGDILPGQIAGATAEALAWKTPIFDVPVRLKWDVLSRLDQIAAARTAPEAFGFTIRDGGYLLGDLTGLTAETVSLRSARHGEVTLRRSEVTSIRRVQAANLLIWAGPSGPAGWEAVNGQEELVQKRRLPAKAAGIVPPIVGLAGGALWLPYFNWGAFLKLPIVPEKTEMEFCVRADVRPDFQFTLSTDGGTNNLRLETWAEQIVLVAGDKFQPVCRIKDDEHRVALRVSWDRKARRCAVYSPDGVPLAEWQIPASTVTGQPGLTVMNKGRSLCLELLRVRAAADGPPMLPVNGPHLEMTGGQIVSGDGAAITVTTNNVILTRGGGSGDVVDTVCPLTAVAAIELAPPSPTLPANVRGPETLTFADGTFLSGTLASIQDGTGLLRTSFADAPLRVKLDGVRQFRVKGAPPSGDDAEAGEADSFVVNQTTLRGRLVCDGGPAPRWLPVGALEPVPLPARAGAEIRRGATAGPKTAAPTSLIYTAAGDVLPAEIHAVGQGGIEFQSPFVAATNLSTDLLKAIQFRASENTNEGGFGDPSWQVLKGDRKVISRSGDHVSLEADSSVGNPRGLQGNEIALSMDMQGFGGLRLRLFCAGADIKGATSLVVTSTGNQAVCALENNDDDTQDETRIGIGSGLLDLRLAIDGAGVELFLNGSSIQKYPVERSKRPGVGIVLEPCGLWGNAPRPLKVSRYKIKSTPGQVGVPVINPEAKAQALTVPRFLKDNPPRHALLASNGDVLRGEIEGTTRSHLAFRTGLENLNVPLDRVEAAIFLEKPAAEAAPEASTVRNETQRFLEQPVTRTLKLKGVQLTNVTNFLAGVVGGLTFKDAAAGDGKSADFTLGGVSLERTLDQVCTAFGLNYWVDAEHRVTLLTAGGGKKDMIQKFYWLKTDPFEGRASPREALYERGVGFPDGASVDWQKGVRLLKMNNTPINQERLAGVVARSLGGQIDPPTHWLALNSGGNLAMRAERFGPDDIVGQHPVYGRCQVPLSSVYSINSTAPGPTAAVRSLGDWKLVAAPEPVLPENGGQSSTLLGKESKTFKLPLLNGGEFDLAKKRGKVVVLDFWATWCGPCIKSLPGTMSAVAGFPSGRVELIGVNQNEPDERVKSFVQRQNWKLTVAMDAGGRVGRDYGADAIPHTVVVGPDGKVAWVKTGASAEGEAELVAAIKKLLE